MNLIGFATVLILGLSSKNLVKRPHESCLQVIFLILSTTLRGICGEPWLWERCTWWFNGFKCNSVHMNHLIETWPVAVLFCLVEAVGLWICGRHRPHAVETSSSQTHVTTDTCSGGIWSRIAGIIALRSVANHAWKSILCLNILYIRTYICKYIHTWQ